MPRLWRVVSARRVHTNAAHGLSADAYRERFGLPGEEPFDPPRSFEARLAVLQRRVEQVGDARVPKAEVLEGEPSGIWVQTWRYAYRRGSLDPLRARRLESLPGWVWTTR